MPKFIKLVFLCLVLSLIVVQAQAFPGKASTPQDSAATENFTEGTIVETMDAAGYTYVCLEKNGQKSWAAIPATEVKVGEEVAIANGMVMSNFTSKSLGRTFDAIIFSQGIVKR